MDMEMLGNVGQVIAASLGLIALAAFVFGAGGLAAIEFWKYYKDTMYNYRGEV